MAFWKARFFTNREKKASQYMNYYIDKDMGGGVYLGYIRCLFCNFLQKMGDVYETKSVKKSRCIKLIIGI